MQKSRPCLTAKQLRWIEEYLVDFNGTAAATRAGYSEKSARSIAHENLTKPDILAVLQARQTALANELHITRQGVVQGLLEAVDLGRNLQNPAAMVMALREISKILGFNVPEVRRVVFDPAISDPLQELVHMQDHELLALMDACH